MSSVIQTLTVIAIAAAAGFAVGYQLQRSTAPMATTDTASAPIVDPEVASLPAALPRPAIEAAPSAARDLPRAVRGEPVTAGPEESAQQAYDSIALVISEQISTGARTADQQMAIASAAHQLSLAQRQQLMEQYVSAQNRGELGPEDPPPL